MTINRYEIPGAEIRRNITKLVEDDFDKVIKELKTLPLKERTGFIKELLPRFMAVDKQKVDELWLLLWDDNGQP